MINVAFEAEDDDNLLNLALARTPRQPKKDDQKKDPHHLFFSSANALKHPCSEIQLSHQQQQSYIQEQNRGDASSLLLSSEHKCVPPDSSCPTTAGSSLSTSWVPHTSSCFHEDSCSRSSYHGQLQNDTGGTTAEPTVTAFHRGPGLPLPQRRAPPPGAGRIPFDALCKMLGRQPATSGLVVESPAARTLWNTCIAAGSDTLMRVFECESLGLHDLTDSHSKDLPMSPQETRLRADIYRSIFQNFTSPAVAVVEVVEPSHPFRLAMPRNQSAWSAIYTGASEENEEKPLHTDDDASLGRGNQTPAVLGALLGAVQDVTSDMVEVIRDDDPVTHPLSMSSSSLAESTNDNNDQGEATPRRRTRCSMASIDVDQFYMTIGRNPSLNFHMIPRAGNFVLNCSKVCSPVFFVQHNVSLWSTINRKIMGRPTLQCQRPPANSLRPGDMLVADRGEGYQQRRQERLWPFLWDDILHYRGAQGNLELRHILAPSSPQTLTPRPCPRCTACGQGRVLANAFSHSALYEFIVCDGCERQWHPGCLLNNDDSIEENFAIKDLHWFCKQCRHITECGVIAQPSCSNDLNNRCVIRGSDLSTIQPCSSCKDKGIGSRDVNIDCRLYKGHLDGVLGDGNDNKLQRQISVAQSIISALTNALEASERRNFRLQRALEQKDVKAASAPNAPLWVQGSNSGTMVTALKYWAQCQRRCRIYRERVASFAPPLARPAAYSSGIQAAYAASAATAMCDSDEEDEATATLLSTGAASPAEDDLGEGGNGTSSFGGRRMTESVVQKDPSNRIAKEAGASGIGPECSSRLNARPQSIARVLLKGSFDPDRAGIEHTISFNEANIQAKKLRPWPRGISWNCKRLTWSVRFWRDDGRTLVATSVPARKHGGVAAAFQKATALRKRSFIHVLARVAGDLTQGKMGHPRLQWSHYNCEWQTRPATVDSSSTVTASKTFPAATESQVRSAWLQALEWLADQGDKDARMIHSEAAATELHSEDTPPTAASCTIRSGAGASRPLHFSSEDTATVPRTLRRRSSLVTNYIQFPAAAENEDAEDDAADFEPRVSAVPPPTNHTIQALQPLPPGLIWARTTSRFFAVFRDPSSSSLHRKKRFKTFDPKKFGGVIEAFNAATVFLQSVDPWITKAAAAAASGRGKWVAPPPVIAMNHKNLLLEDDMDSGEQLQPKSSTQYHPHQSSGAREMTDEVWSKKEEYDEDDAPQGSGTLSSGAAVPEDTPLEHDDDEQDTTTAPDEEEDDSVVSPNDISGNWGGIHGAYSADLPTQLYEMEAELQSLPRCECIKWYRSKKGFSASMNGQTKWFSAYSRGVTEAWNVAYEWVQNSMSSSSEVYTPQDPLHLRLLEPHQSAAATGSTDSSRRRRSMCPHEQASSSHHGGGISNSEIREDEGTKRPRYDYLDPGAVVPNNRLFCELAVKVEHEGIFDSDDSMADANEQAKRLPKVSNICWVPQKQAFSVFYTKDLLSSSKTTKAFNPHYFDGVKRSFRQAILFALKIQRSQSLSAS